MRAASSRMPSVEPLPNRSTSSGPVSMLPQCLHLIASSWMSSAQYGHFFIRRASRDRYEMTEVTVLTGVTEQRRRTEFSHEEHKGHEEYEATRAVRLAAAGG